MWTRRGPKAGRKPQLSAVFGARPRPGPQPDERRLAGGAPRFIDVMTAQEARPPSGASRPTPVWKWNRRHDGVGSCRSSNASRDAQGTCASTEDARTPYPPRADGSAVTSAPATTVRYPKSRLPCRELCPWGPALMARWQQGRIQPAAPTRTHECSTLALSVGPATWQE